MPLPSSAGLVRCRLSQLIRTGVFGERIHGLTAQVFPGLKYVFEAITLRARRNVANCTRDRNDVFPFLLHRAPMRVIKCGICSFAAPDSLPRLQKLVITRRQVTFFFFLFGVT